MEVDDAEQRERVLRNSPPADRCQMVRTDEMREGDWWLGPSGYVKVLRVTPRKAKYDLDAATIVTASHRQYPRLAGSPQVILRREDPEGGRPLRP